MLHLFDTLEFHVRIPLIITLVLILIYEAINGFHDTSNSVVTVIYTCALKYKSAVAISGIFNFLGVTFSGLSVAYTIIHLLPTQFITNSSPNYILAMVSSTLLAAISWNLFTWYLRLPTSSSHTLIGALTGIGIINTLITNNPWIQGFNIQKLIEILLSLIIVPIISLILSQLIMLLLCHPYYKNNQNIYYIHMTPSEQEKKYGKRQPPLLLRAILIISSAGVGFSHGANDGQKGIGLIMLLLIGVIPTNFVINMNATQNDIEHTRLVIKQLHKYYTQYPPNNTFHKKYIQTIDPTQNISYVSQKIQQTSKSPNNNQLTRIQYRTIPFHSTIEKFYQIKSIQTENDVHSILNIINHTLLLLDNLTTYSQLNPEERSELRYLLLYIIDIIEKTYKSPHTSSSEKNYLKQIKKYLLHTIEYAPLWIIITVATSLSLGTIIGWKRVSITIGEKIGKKEMTYAQGLTAQLTTATSIGIASYIGMPVSTTHVLSSSMTGSMLIQGYGIQKKIVKNILITWILTLPISTLLSASLYWIMLQLLF